ncbi:MAG: BTAD domain-containing putative transcriptional regulator, partial [Acidimicrobiia bacterium]
MEFRLLGPLEVTHEGAPVPIDGRDRRLVLALLLAHANETVAADALVAHLAPDPSPEVRQVLQGEIAALQEALNVEAELLNPKAPGYRLDVTPRQVDALLFQDLVNRAEEALADDPAEAREVLGEGLGLWRGVPFADLAGEPGLRPFVTQLEGRRRRAVERRIDAELALGNHEELVPELEALTREHPLEEEFWSQLMLALYRSGRAADALTTYDKAERVLSEELGTEPSEKLQSLRGRIADRDETLDISREVVVEEVTLLFTDLEGSASLWEKHPDEMGEAIARHDRLISAVVADYGGKVFKGTGDGVLAVMPSTSLAVQAAIVSQQELLAEEWGTVGQLKVRMAIHDGDAEHRGDDYFGPTLNRAARLMACGHGGQVLLSSAAKSRLDETDGFELLELGEHRLRSLGEPEVIFQLLAEGLPSEFPPLQVDSAPVHLQAAGFARTVRGYELREQIGEGDFGLVYRAYQASVGREVALKAIRPEYANDPDFVRSFENEGRLVAQLEHPHIVSLYDFWREPDNAYLVMRWMRGGSLRDSLRQGPWRLETALPLIEQIGSALGYAHRHGVLHRDIKPTNVLLDQDGNGYVSDFGLATRLRDPQDASQVWTSSPAYLPPEAERGEAPSARSDIYSFGLLVGELLTGEPPSSERTDLLVPLPEALWAAISKATAFRPEERFETVDMFVAAVREAVEQPVERPRPAAPFAEVRNPYKGLRPFFEADAEDFFGREALVAQLLDKIGSSRLIGVVGASGSGKSSVVRAGLVPALRKGRFDGSDSWFIADCFPGAYPFEELEAAMLRVAVRDPTAIDQLSADPRGLLRVSKQILPDDGSELLLLIDQFEELFTLVDDEDVRQRFLESLATAVTDPRSRVRVIVTLRADFFDRPLQYSPFGELLRDGLVPITPLNEAELTEAVSGPARGVGLEVEPTLLSQVVADVRKQPGVLPLLQYSLTEVFDRRDDGRLTLGAYEASGGVLGALGRRAEEIYATLDSTGQEACQQLFLRLVTVGQADDTRRRITRAELRDLDIDQRALDEVVDQFGTYRLLAFDRDPVSRAPTAEVAHEALLREWQRLRGWIESRREDLLQHRRLASATRDWLEGDREPSYLLRGGRLEQMEEWAAETDLSLTTSERSFLEESHQAEEGRARRRRRRRGAVVGGLAVAAAVSLVLAVFAFAQRGEAEAQAREAASRELAAASVGNLAIDPELALLLALEAIETTVDQDGFIVR